MDLSDSSEEPVRRAADPSMGDVTGHAGVSSQTLSSGEPVRQGGQPPMGDVAGHAGVSSRTVSGGEPVRQGRQPPMGDVAGHAGVSSQTVSSGEPVRQGRQPSMGDVARHAGVSSQTVSRVSNGHSNVEPATRARVIESMRVLGYRPNSAARALRLGRFRTIGVIMFNLRTFGNMRTLDAIATQAARADYSVTLIPVQEATLDQVSGAYSRLAEQAVDGVIMIFEAHLLGDAQFTLPPGLPVVVIDSNASDAYTVVDTDQAEGARKATEHLLALGHRQIWHIAGPETSFSAGHRVESWQRTLRDAGIEPPPVLHGDWSTESGHRHGLTLGRRDDVTAIFAGNDQMALGAMRALHELGRDVPGDISVVGFDDLEEAHSFWPPLTTIRQDFGEVGRQAIQKLLSKVDGEREISKVSVPTQLIVRQSTAAPRR